MLCVPLILGTVPAHADKDQTECYTLEKLSCSVRASWTKLSQILRDWKIQS